MKRILLIGAIALFALNPLLWAQERTVTGTVTSEQDASPVPGVNVILKGSSTGTVTDIDGRYRITVPSSGGILVFSFIGLATEEVSVGNQSTIDMVMSADIKQLGEIIVTAVGVVREQKAIGFSAQKMDSDELLTARETNLGSALAGKIAGVDITSNSGPGASARIVIRGTSSISGDNQPLIIVDGVPISNTNLASVDRFTAPDFGNRVGDLNPDDIETLTVLKGPAATALYGQRAANGAIVITSKKGKKNQKTSVSVNSSMRFDNPLRYPDYQNVYGQGSLGKIDSSRTTNWGARMNGQPFINANGHEDTYSPYPDNVKEFYETGRTTINSFAVQGGGETGTYRFSFTNMDQAGIAPNTNLNRMNFGLNGSQEFKNNFYSSFGANYVRTRNKGRVTNGFNSDDAIASIVNFLPRNSNPDSLRNFRNTDGSPRLFLGLNQNPYWTMEENYYSGEVDRLLGFGQLGYNPFEWLNISYKIGVDVYNERRLKKTAVGSVGNADGKFWSDNIFEEQINSDFLITINHDLSSKLNLNLLLGHNVWEQRIRSEFQEGQSLIDPDLFLPQNTLTNSSSSTIPQHRRIIGAFFDLGLSYNDYLFLNITGRNDWNSTLPVENQSFFYPSVSTSAVISEIFDISSPVLSFAKLRANYAQVGSGTDAFLLNFTYSPETSIFQLFGVDNTYPFRGIPGFAGSSTIPPANLKPEITSSFEIGTDLKFFDSKVNLDITYYNALTRDQIVRVSTPGSTGFVQAILNAGQVRNVGIEVALNAVVLSTPNFMWNTAINFARNVNKVEELPEGYDFINVPGTRTDPGLRAYQNEQIGTINGSDWRRDSLGNILINPLTGLRLQENNQKIGNITPQFRLGFQNNFSYKGFNVSFLIDWRNGGQMHSQTVQRLLSGGHTTETLNRDVAYIDKGVILLEEDAEGNAISTRPNDIPITYQEYWAQLDDVDADGVFDASYVKLREARISYSLPTKLLNKTPFGIVEVGVEGRNLALLYSAIPHIDPEVSFYGPTNAQGIEAFNMPSTRSLGINLRFTF